MSLFMFVLIATVAPNSGAPITMNFLLGAVVGAFISAIVFTAVERGVKELEGMAKKALYKPFVAVGLLRSQLTDHFQAVVITLNPVASNVFSTLTIGRQGYVIDFAERSGRNGAGKLLCLSSEDALDRGTIVLRTLNSNDAILAEITLKGQTEERVEMTIVR